MKTSWGITRSPQALGRKSSQCAFWLLLCLLCVPYPALAGETIIWNGAGHPGAAGMLRPDPSNYFSLFPDSPSGNRVVVNGDIPSGYVFGGLHVVSSDSAAAETANNSVSTLGGRIEYGIYGGYADSHSGTAAATGNRVSVSGGSIGAGVGGGDALSDTGTAVASGNRVSVSGGSIDYNVDGGYAYSSTATATATSNSVSVSGGRIEDGVYGGYANSYASIAAATSNSVSVSGGSIGFGVDGGSAWSDSGTAAAVGNRVSISGGSLDSDIDGGYAWSHSGVAVASGNRVSVSGGSVHYGVYGGYALSEHGTATVMNNRASVSGGSLEYDVDGGSAWSYAGTVTATGNSVRVSGGSIAYNVFGGSAWSDSGTAAATGNSVRVSGGSIGGNVYGGFAWSDTGTAVASGNRVSVSGGSISGNVYGGSAYSNSGAAVDNAVTLSGSPVFAATSGLYGGFMPPSDLPGTDAFTGNTLNIWNYTGSAVGSVQNFKYYDFILPAALRNGDTLLTVTGNAGFDDSQSAAGSGVQSAVSGVNIMGGGTPLQAGESVSLMSYGSATNTVANGPGGNGIIQGRKGISLLYNWQLNQDGNNLTATVIDVPQVNPQTRALAEGRLAGLAFLNQGADLMAGTGMSAARSAALQYGLSPFFAAQGGASRYDAGSHVDVDGFSLMAGLAWNAPTEYGSLLLGAFFEAGWGKYDSHNSFSHYASVDGSGDTGYYGSGVLGRFDYNATGPGNVYTEVSFRTGRSETEFSSGALRDVTGRKAEYDSGSAYHGAHAGLGYIWNITDASSLDFFAKYFWTHQESDSVRVTGDPIRFNSVDSHRWRGGVRFSHTLAAKNGLALTPYIGAGYEHEFDGKAKATAYGQAIDTPDLTGGVGMGELGFSLKPFARGAADGLAFDLGVQGYAGVREGMTGSFQVRWEF